MAGPFSEAIGDSQCFAELAGPQIWISASRFQSDFVMGGELIRRLIASRQRGSQKCCDEQDATATEAHVRRW